MGQHAPHGCAPPFFPCGSAGTPTGLPPKLPRLEVTGKSSLPLELYHPSEDYPLIAADYLPRDKETVNLFGFTLSRHPV